jgi:flagellar M-ring protein FliF
MKSVLAGLGTLGPFRLAALAMVAVGTLGILAFLTLHRTTDHFALLYSELDVREAAQIADSLDRQHIAHQVGRDGTQILVPVDQVARARLQLAKESLPSGGSIGYEIFDRTDGFTANQFQQNMNQLRALEGELGRTIRAIDGVRAARVHLVLAKREPFARDRQEAQASVMLTTAGAGRLDHESIQAIVNMVAAAVPGLRPGNISVVDSRGELLARAGDPANQADTAAHAEELRHGIELRMSRAVETMLERSLGPGHVRAEASVDMNFDRVNESEEKYDPDGQVVRSTQTSTDNSRTTEQNNSVSVQNNLPNADAGSTPGGSQDARQDETTNYEIGRIVRSSVHDQAVVRRISLAVMVDGVQQRGADGKMSWQPRSQEELDRIGRLVKSAVGFDQKRGDQLEVVNMRFAGDDAEVAPAPAGMFGTGLDKADLLPLAQSLVMGLVATLALFLVLRPMVARLTSIPDGTLALADGGAGFGASQNAAETRPLLAGSHDGGGMKMLTGPQDAVASEELVNMANVDGQMRASSVRRLTDLVERHPEESLSIVRGWMQQESS